MSSDRKISPTGSYTIRVPQGVKEDIDGRVASFWIPDDDLLLQSQAINEKKASKCLHISG